MINYFLPLKIVRARILELCKRPGETGDNVTYYVFDVLAENNPYSKIIAFWCDNTNNYINKVIDFISGLTSMPKANVNKKNLKKQSV